jgi:hypothetical protein
MRIDKESWEAGYQAGLNGKEDRPGDDIQDHLAWESGYQEGKEQAKSLAVAEDDGMSNEE